MVRVEGHGPVTPQWLRQFLGEQAKFTITPVMDLAGQAPVDAYEIPARHRVSVRLMTPADIFPWGSSLSRHMQIDHTEPFQHGPAAAGAGQSRIGNYGPMSVLHHRIKTHGGWQVEQPFPGIYVWRDPHGGFYLVDHTGTRRVDMAHERAGVQRRDSRRPEAFAGSAQPSSAEFAFVDRMLEYDLTA